MARLAGIPEDVIRRSKEILARVENNGHGSGCAAGAAKKESRKAVQVQLDLFQGPEQEIIDRLRHMDISRTTPMEALNLLSEWQTRTRSRS